MISFDTPGDFFFPNLSDLQHITIWEQAHKKHPERGVPFSNNARLSTSGWDNTLHASPPHGEP